MSGDENSSANSDYEEDEEESHISYRSMEEEYQQQQQQIQDDKELFNSSSDYESIDSNLSNADAAKRLSNGKKDEQKQAEQEELKKAQEKTIDIVPKAIKYSAISSFNIKTISNDLFKTCCVNQCCLKISPFHEPCNFEPCMQFIRERRKDLNHHRSK